MPASEAFAGSETVSTTEWSLTTDSAGPDLETSDGVFHTILDLNALATGDRYDLRLYEKVLSGSSQRLVEIFRFAQVQSGPNWISPAFVLMHGWDWTLDQDAGSDRTITWSIRKTGATPTEAFTGTETVGTTEWSLTTDSSFTPDADTSDGVFQLWLDLNALAAGDIYELKGYEKAQSGDTQRVSWTKVWNGAQPRPVWVTPAAIYLHGWDFTLIKVAGTDRSIDWSIRKVA